MAYVARMLQTPEALPQWYPAPDDNDPAAYPLRFQWMQTLVYLMYRLGAIEERPLDAPSSADAPAAVAMFGNGSVIGPPQCDVIAREMRVFVSGVPQNVFEDLRNYWNDLQARLKSEVEARGEVAISGFEPFPYDPQALRNDLVHWGAFNAIAAQNGGYRLS
jgi:hypothetical protein